MGLMDFRKVPDAGLPARLQDAALNATFAPSQILVESHVLPGDTSDDQAWTRAIVAARAAAAFGGVSLIVGSKKLYEFAAMVDFGGLNNIIIRGRQGGVSLVKAKAGAGVLTTAFSIANNSLDAGDVIFENFAFDGGMTNGAALGTNPARVTGSNTATERVFATDRLAAAIKVRGDNVPGSAETYPTVGNITIRSVKVYGMESLPILITGVKGHAVVTEYVAERCLDTGFTFNESVSFINNRVYYSADNGVSLSRGNKNVVCVGNTFTDSWFNGVFISGFDQDAGPTGFVCVGNQIVRSYEAGIGMFIGPKNGVVMGNTIDTVYRGTAAYPSTIGVGIRVGGYVAVAEGEVDLWAENITITGNTLINCARGGFLITAKSKNIEATANTIINPGSELDSTGATVSSADTNQNFGILLSGGATAADWGEIRLKLNTITDDRAVPLANRGTYITAAAVTKTVVQFNNWNGTRVANDEKSYIGPSAMVGKTTSTDTRFELVSADGGLKSLIYRVASGSLFRVATTSDSTLELGTYQTIGSATVTAAMQVNRALSQVRFTTPPRLPSYTTALRPSASSFTAGAQIYDTDLQQVMTSDGTNWIGAASLGSDSKLAAAQVPDLSGTYGRSAVQIFTSSSTYTPPAGATSLTIAVVGGGGGGGAGRQGAAGTVRCGGGGGAGGARTTRTIPVSALTFPITVTVGAGGAGGAAQATADTNGAAGTGGGTSSFGSDVRAGGGSAGGGGSATTGTAGTAGSGSETGGAGAAASTTGLLGNSGGSSAAASGGGAGGGITVGDAASVGGAGGVAHSASTAAAAVGVVDGATPSAGASRTANSGVGGGGGAGGSSSITTAAQAGATGGLYGGGGGGGGASLNGSSSGAGGAGRDGIVIVFAN